MPGQHAVLSPSGADRWMKCTPSARFEQGFPDSDSEYAREGTLAHSLAELYVKRKLGRIQLKPYEKELAAIMAHELYQPEMKAHCDNWAVYIIEKFNGYKAPFLYTEDKVDVSDFIEEGYGHLDLSIVSENILDINDFKYGKGVPVEAERNAQMMCYALGAYKKFSILFDIDIIRLTIFQPRLDVISEWEISIGKLMAWAETQLRPAAELAWRGKGEYVPGDHCRFCRGRSQCKALMNYTNEVAADVFKDAKLPDPNKMTPEETVKVLDSAKMIEKWLNAVGEYALEQATTKNVKWPGMKLVEGRSNRIYSSDAVVQEELLKAGYKMNQISETKILGITKMTAELGAADFNRLVDPFLIKPKGSPTLVNEKDKRPELNSSAEAADIFKDVDLSKLI